MGTVTICGILVAIGLVLIAVLNMIGVS